jgi:ribosome-associated protein
MPIAGPIFSTSGRACSSVVEHGAHNPRVAGSIPAGPTTPAASAGIRVLTVSNATTDTATQENDASLPLGRERALLLADIISDTPARDTVVLDIHELSPFTDYFVITAGANERQLRAINRTLAERMAAAGVRPQRTEGAPASGWIVVDFGDVLVHIFSEDQREFYRLEDLWAEAPTLLAIQ